MNSRKQQTKAADLFGAAASRIISKMLTDTRAGIYVVLRPDETTVAGRDFDARPRRRDFRRKTVCEAHET